MGRSIIIFLALIGCAISNYVTPQKPTDNQFNNVEITFFMTPNIEGKYTTYSHRRFHAVNSDKWIVGITAINLDLPNKNITLTQLVPSNATIVKFTFGSNDIFQTKKVKFIIGITCKETTAKTLRSLNLRMSSLDKHFTEYINTNHVSYYGNCFNYLSVDINYKNTETGVYDFYYYSTNSAQYVNKGSIVKI
ncbi:hypothetical protein pCPXV0285 [Cowpox virus]|uniref:Uncharacterized protein n=1 Tax=Cowpox virus TaxID=10243 RepID=A0A212PMK3_COWPX|nr:hypothetical protein pCPXV0285 [Cowpox virus]